MKINISNFWQTLPAVLGAIANAQHVAFDAEMSGLRTKSIPRVLTPMFLDHTYEAGVLAKLMDRTLSFPYDALLFLGSHGFSFERAFQTGIPSLSRHGARGAREVFLWNPREVEVEFIDVNEKTGDPDTRQFYEDARDQIFHWLKNSDLLPFAAVTNPHGGRMSNLQIRLLNQLVQTEFKNCRAVYRKALECMQIVHFDAKHEQKSWEQKLEARRDAVASDSSSKHLQGATAGRLRSTRPPTHRKSRQERTLVHRRQSQSRPQRPRGTTQDEPSGSDSHNQLFDLCFLYQSFLGPLPETVQNFKKETRKLFPHLVGTKHIASVSNTGTAASDKNLFELYRSFKSFGLPRIIAVNENLKNFWRQEGKMAHSHEAGNWQLDDGCFVCQAVSSQAARATNARLLPNSIIIGKRKSISPAPGIWPAADLRKTPSWDTEFWNKHGNKLHWGNGKVLDLAAAAAEE
ncbi:ribonuclease H-like domain-containing protein [Podospora didyma]|uniref:Ribonuclease H-like domain-containing protein n=1 Tax=Podospora didyma TaxID=330526 RepID=A0AAE0K126_9PEZI|nr:ribonuclease H-like domain-containing protein [Podospora didyma]